MTAPLPVTIIAGYLGAGKTTLINHLLANTRNRAVMVMVNDFGDIAIDAELIAARGTDTITLTNGCVCCSMGTDLFTAFSRALDRTPRPDHLVIEASGVAEPRRIADLARAEPDLQLDAIIALADCRNAMAQAQDPLIARTLQNQFAAAGLIALSKTDLATPQDRHALQAWLTTLNPNAPHLTCPLDPDIILAPAPAMPLEYPPSPADHEHTHARWSWRATTPLAVQHLQHIIDNPPAGVLRLKGLSHDPAIGRTTEFHIAGAQADLTSRPIAPAAKAGAYAVAIGLAGKLDTAALDRLFSTQSAILELQQ